MKSGPEAVDAAPAVAVRSNASGAGSEGVSESAGSVWSAGRWVPVRAVTRPFSGSMEDWDAMVSSRRVIDS